MGKCVEKFHGTMQQGSVRCQYSLESLFSCRRDKLWQKRVEQWFSHQVKIKEAYLTFELVCELVEFLCGQLSLFPGMFRAEVAVEIACIGYFYVTAIYHCLVFSCM